MRRTAIAAVLLMGLACMAEARQAGASGLAGARTIAEAPGYVTVAQANTSQTGTPPSTAPASSAQPPTSTPATAQPGSSDQSGGSGDDSGANQPANGDQGSGTDSSSGAVANPPAQPQENLTPPPPPVNSAVDAQAKLLLQRLTARQLDPRLPAMPLSDWFTQQIGKRAEIDWTTGDCSDEADYSGSGSDTDGASGASYDPALCTEGQALFYGPDGKASLDRYVVVQITVGTRQAGVNRDPSKYGPDAVTIFVFDGSSTRTLSRLGELTGALQSMN